MVDGVLCADIGELVQRAHYRAELRVLHALLNTSERYGHAVDQAIYSRYATIKPQLEQYGYLDRQTHRFERIRWGPQPEKRTARHLLQFAAWLQTDVMDLAYSMTRSPAKPSSRLM